MKCLPVEDTVLLVGACEFMFKKNILESLQALA